MAATAASEHPVPAHAVAECAGALLEAGHGAPEVLWVVGGMPFAGALGEICAALARLTGAGSSVGIADSGVVLGGRVCQDGPALGVVALWGSGCVPAWKAPGAPLAESLGRVDGGVERDWVAVVAADPFSVSGADLAPAAGSAGSVVGGFIAGGAAAGTNRLVIDGDERDEGAVVLWCPPRVAEVVLSHGCEPVAEPMEVTEVVGGVVTAMDDLPAAEAFEAALANAAEGLVGGSAQVGLCLPGGSPELLGVRRAPAGLEVATGLSEGDIVQPVVRSGPSCRRGLLAALSGRGQPARRACGLVFLDLGRPSVGTDAATLAEVLHSADVGMLCGGVLPAAGDPRSRVRGAAAVAVLGG